jgi:hypothetical protein
MHPTLSPALVRTLARGGPVAIMICLKSLKSGAEIEYRMEQFGAFWWIGAENGPSSDGGSE